MIKHTQLKFWQILYKYSPSFAKRIKFWREFGNPYTNKLLWYCDMCNLKIEGTKYRVGNMDICKSCK